MNTSEPCYGTGCTPNVCIVGAGVSGILAAIKLKTELGFSSVTIIEENNDVGGQWLSGYPGQCTESLAHLCSYSFELKPDWSQNYASQKEMLDYLRAVAHKYGLYASIKFNSQVKSLTWDLKAKKWNAVILNKRISVMKHAAFDLVICATGSLRVPEVPEGLSNFKGPILHTVSWDNTVDLEDKVIGVIGSGQAVVDLLPAIAPKSKKIHYFQKEPSWILPREQFGVPGPIKMFFEKVHVLLFFFRWFLFACAEIFYFPIFIKNSILNHFGHYFAKKYLATEIDRYDPLRWQLEPKYPFGFKPIVHSSEYYKTMKSNKVVLHLESITHVANSSVTTTTDGIQELDILILAPEEDSQKFFAPIKIIDKFSQDLMTRWKNARPRVRTYYGLTTSVTPNLFFLNGPHTTIFHNSPTFLLECQVGCIVKLLEEMMKRCAKVVEVEEFAEDEFLADLEDQFKRTVWSTMRAARFTNSGDAMKTIWPWSSVRYWCRTRTVDKTKWRFY